MTQTFDRLGPVASHDRRRRTLKIVLTCCAALLVLAAATAFALRWWNDDSRRTYLSSDGWPKAGQGAYQLGGSRPVASPNEQAAPIASLAKVMTAVVVLKHLPLDPSAEGPSLTIDDADVADTAQRAHRGESVVAVSAGERLTERQALMALLLPSANNIAIALARYVSGSVDAFVYEMNTTARSLGMRHTVYTDPSGFDAGTVSTAIDQLTLAQRAAKDDTLTQIMDTPAFPLPVAGMVHNTDTLLGQDGFIGMKTGSDDAAGGCFMFRTFRSINGFNTELIGVVMGQPGHDLVDAGQYAAKQLADRLAPTPAHP